MSTVRLKSISEDTAEVNFHEWLHTGGGTGYETDVTLVKGEDGSWRAEMNLGDMPGQDTPEEALDRMHLYLKAMSRVVKGRNIKHLHIDSLFKPKSR